MVISRSKHIHKYRRTRYGKSTIYKCVISGCNHFIQKDIAEGRLCVCWRCGNPFIITKRTLRCCPAMPHCEECFPKTEQDLQLDDAIEDLIK